MLVVINLVTPKVGAKLDLSKTNLSSTLFKFTMAIVINLVTRKVGAKLELLLNRLNLPNIKVRFKEEKQALSY